MTTDELSNKVINLFARHRRGEDVDVDRELQAEGGGGEIISSPDGFTYISLKQDCNGQNDEKAQLEIAGTRHYMVKMMEPHKDGHTLRLSTYHVPGDRLEEFLLGLSHRPGKLLEIKQFIPDHMA